jgi:hypothetical protein
MYTASTGQALAHSPQRMHRLLLTMTPPPFLWLKAPVGQAITHGAGSQAKQMLASNPVESPPDERMRIPALSHDSVLCTSLAQANEHEWQPMQRSILGARSIFIR